MQNKMADNSGFPNSGLQNRVFVASHENVGTMTTTNEGEMCSKNESKESNSPKEKLQLKRELGLFSSVSLIVGVMIGSGIFVSPSLALKQSGSVGLCLVIWVVCGIISLLGSTIRLLHDLPWQMTGLRAAVTILTPLAIFYGFHDQGATSLSRALCFAELGLVMPRSGAEYIYLQEAFGGLHKFWGPLPSFLCSWVYVIVCRPAEVAVIILAFSEYVCQPFEMYFGVISTGYRDLVRKLISILGLCLLTYINFISVKMFVRVANLFTITKLIACCIVALAGIYELCLGNTENISQGFEGSQISMKHISLAFYYCLWPYDGWSTVTIVTEEVKRPEVNILKSILIAVPLVTVVYCMMNVAYMTILTIPEMIEAPAVAVVVGNRTLGVMNFIIPLGVAISAFGSALSIQFSIARLCYVAAKGGHMMEAFSYIHMRRLTPAPAVFLQGFFTLIFILAGNIATLIDFASFLIWIFYGLAMVSLLITRRTMKDVKRPFQVQLWVPVLMIFVSLFLCLVPIITDPSPRYFTALVLIGIGVAVYIPFVYYKIRPHWIDKFTYFVQVLMEVVPEEKNMD